MKTPLANFVKNYQEQNYIRLHMPGHKGKGMLYEKFDITEIKGADSLFEANGVIAESEANLTKLFGSKMSVYSTQGSTSCIYTMLSLAAKTENNKRPLFIAPRNAHKAFINGCILIDADVKWIYPKDAKNMTSGKCLPKDIENAILNSDRKPSAVYITSPNYLGEMADIKSIAEICHKNNTLLIVDNAHGAYLNFLEQNKHPIYLGADMCCDSAHKTLPVLTGGAYLHINNNVDDSISNNVKTTMSLFSSTSPSYLTLASLDECNNYLDTNIKTDLKKLTTLLKKFRKNILSFGYKCISDEPLKITIIPLNIGLTGNQLADELRKYKIECEYSDEISIVLMFSTKNTEDEIKTVENVLYKIKQPKTQIKQQEFKFPEPKVSLALRKAAFMPSEQIATDAAENRICSKIVVACPPGVPIVVSGEVIDKNVINVLKKYGILYVNVLKL